MLRTWSCESKHLVGGIKHFLDFFHRQAVFCDVRDIAIGIAVEVPIERERSETVAIGLGF